MKVSNALDKYNLISTSSIKNLPVSPRRVQLVANFIRGKKVNECIDFLSFDKRKASDRMLVLLNSAIANAITKSQEPKDNLYVADVKVGQGVFLKGRGTPAGRGRYHPMKKKTTNLVVIIGSLNSTEEKTNE